MTILIVVYDIQRMIQSLAERDVRVALCSTCMDARGLTDLEVVPGATRSSMKELAQWALDADWSLVF